MMLLLCKLNQKPKLHAGIRVHVLYSKTTLEGKGCTVEGQLVQNVKDYLAEVPKNLKSITLTL